MYSKTKSKLVTKEGRRAVARRARTSCLDLAVETMRTAVTAGRDVMGAV